MELNDRPPAVRGHVIAETRDAAGELVDRWEGENTYTLLAAALHAAALNGEAASLGLTAMGLGATGFPIDLCDSASGWTVSSCTVTADSTVFVQGGGSIKVAVGSSTTGTAKHTDIYAGSMDATGDWIEVSLRVDFTGRLTKASTYLQVYTGAGSTNFYRVSLSTIEGIAGALVDGTWKRNIRIPVASFSVGGGSPSWADVRGIGLVVAANAVGAVNVWIDDARVWQTVDTSSSNLTLPGQLVSQPLTSLTRSGRVVTAVAFWNMAEAVGTYYVAGLFAGSTLVSLLPFSYQKDAGLTLTLTWTLTANGG